MIFFCLLEENWRGSAKVRMVKEERFEKKSMYKF